MTDNTITTASNSEVVKRFGLSLIMRRAWFNFKFVTGCKARGFANCLRDSWSSFRVQINDERRRSAQKAELAAGYKGDIHSRSPLNPHRSARFPEWGSKRNGEWVTSVCGR